MQPGSYNLILTENSTNVLAFTISGITTTVGYSAKIDIRADETPTGTLLLALSSPASGLTLAATASGLTITLTITEAQVDTLTPLVLATHDQAAWSLKVTAPDTTTLQYLKGLVGIERTPST